MFPARSSTRRADDADLIRARLRALLEDGRAARGWLPDGADEEQDEDDWTVEPVRGRRHLAVVPDPSGQPGSPHTPDDDARATVRLSGAAPAPTVRAGGRPAPDEEPDELAGRHRAAGAAVRVTPGRTSARALWVAALVAAAVVGGWSWLHRPSVDPVPAVAPAAEQAAPSVDASMAPVSPGAAVPAVVVVSVVGQVVTPGLVTLPAGSRVADAIVAAGGLLPDADPAAFNAAALLSDGQQVAVGVPGVAATPGVAAAPGAGASAPSGLVDLNTATVADLDALPGIGPVLAQRIVDHRTSSGPFGSVLELDDVSGIGPTLYAEISPLVTV